MLDKNDMLLVTAYWTPWNNAQTIRWWQYSFYFNFAILTVKYPLGFYDESLVESKNYHPTKRVRGWVPVAIVHGLILSLYSILYAKRFRVIVYTTPPETLLIGAWINQLRGYKVIVDLQDQVDRKLQRWKIFNPIYRFLISRIKNVTAVADFIYDGKKKVIYHSWDGLAKKSNQMKVMSCDRNLKWIDYIKKLRNGFVPDYFNKPKGYYGYGSSSIANIRMMWKEKSDVFDELFHPEIACKKEYNYWFDDAMEMEQYIRSVIDG